jgi:tRNA(Ile)-lysidine synthase
MSPLLFVKKFLKERFQTFPKETERTLLLGYSGGTDSTILFHILKILSQTLSFRLCLAHIDHSWRQESEQERVFLEQQAQKAGLPFFWKKLQLKNATDLENQCRQERMAFFKEILIQERCLALCLAHQAQDQAETVLKRILESASLFSWRGMEIITSYEGMSIWRPLLFFPKTALSNWLKTTSEKSGFSDPTNEESRFLRGRMRKQLFPLLKESFGKNPLPSLISIGETGKSLRAYFQKKLQPLLDKRAKGFLGECLNLSNLSLELLEMELLLTLYFQPAPSFPWIKQVAQALFQNKTNCHFAFGSFTVIVDRKILYCLKKPLKDFSKQEPLKEGFFFCSQWKWDLSIEKGSENVPLSSEPLWLSFFLKGRLSLEIPEGNYILISKKESICSKTFSLSRFWNQKRVPAFLRMSLPLVATTEGKIVAELLTGNFFSKKSEKKMNISFNITHLS